jgi:hypothetical protein
MSTDKSYDELERERTKLMLLIEEALKNGISFKESKALLEQSQKVDSVLLKTPLIQNGIMKNRMNHKNHGHA